MKLTRQQGQSAFLAILPPKLLVAFYVKFQLDLSSLSAIGQTMINS